MGSGMAAQVLNHGFQLSVFNRNPQRAEDLVSRGAISRATPAEVAGDV